MKSSLKNLRHRTRQLGGAGIKALSAGIALLLVCSCQEAEEDVFERRYALAQIPSFEVEDHLALLDHKDPNVRYLALANLLQMGALAQPDEDDEKGAALEKLTAKLQALLTDPAPKVRAIAAFAPINRAGEGAEERLLARLDDAHSAVRVEAVVSLGEGDGLSPAGTERVIRLLEDENILVRLHALEALGTSASTQRAEMVIEQIGLALARRETPEVLKALEVLSSIESEQAERILMSRLDDKDERVVKVAVQGLALRRAQPLEEWVLKSLAEGQMPEKFLIETLAQVATERSCGTAISMLDHRDSEVRSLSGAILEQIGDQTSFDALASTFAGVATAMEKGLALPSDDLSIEYEEFAELLARVSGMGEELGIYTFDRKGLLALLHSTSGHDQMVAMAQLAGEQCYDVDMLGDDAGEPGFVERLAVLATSKSPLTRAFAYEALGASARPEAGEALGGGIVDSAFQVRFAALEALVDYTENTGQRTPLRSVYERRTEFEPTSYATDDPNLLMRERLEKAIRRFEPSWTSVARAKTELRGGKPNATGLLAAEFLAPDEDAMNLLLGALATGSSGAKTYALRAVDEHAGEEHVSELRTILATETDPDRQKALAEIIAQAASR